jgi:hypothetical protein
MNLFPFPGASSRAVWIITVRPTFAWSEQVFLREIYIIIVFQVLILQRVTRISFIEGIMRPAAEIRTGTPAAWQPGRPQGSISLSFTLTSPRCPA